MGENLKTEAEKRPSYEWGVFWMLLSASFLSVSFLFLKINLEYVPYFLTLFYRFAIPFVVIVVFICIRREWKEIITSASLPLQILRAVCVLVAQYGIAYYITQSSLLNATVLLNASPLFIPLIEWTFLGHRPGKSTILGALLAFLGVILVLHPDRSLLNLFVLIGLLAALGQAGSQVLYGMKSKTENLLVSLFYLFFFTTLVSGIVAVLWGHHEILTHITTHHSWLLGLSILLMGAGTLLNQYFRGLAYRHGNPSNLATFLYFSVFVSALFDWLVFNKIPTLLTIIGSVLIILGGVVKIFLRAHILKKRAKK